MALCCLECKRKMYCDQAAAEILIRHLDFMIIWHICSTSDISMDQKTYTSYDDEEEDDDFTVYDDQEEQEKEAVPESGKS